MSKRYDSFEKWFNEQPAETFENGAMETAWEVWDFQQNKIDDILKAIIIQADLGKLIELGDNLGTLIELEDKRGD